MFKPYIGGIEDEYNQYVKEIGQMNGVMKEGGYTCYYEDNIKIANLIPKDKIVVDVGCSFGLQQVLYREHKGYIGIQEFKGGINCDCGFRENLKALFPTAKIIQGMFKDVWQQTGITEENKDEYFGVSNHSLWNDPVANAEDINIFKKLFPTNHYVTDEAGRRVEISQPQEANI